MGRRVICAKDLKVGQFWAQCFERTELSSEVRHTIYVVTAQHADRGKEGYRILVGFDDCSTARFGSGYFDTSPAVIGADVVAFDSFLDVLEYIHEVNTNVPSSS